MLRAQTLQLLELPLIVSRGARVCCGNCHPCSCDVDEGQFVECRHRADFPLSLFKSSLTEGVPSPLDTSRDRLP